ncbi:prolipoprotein diacylglyceryl transferase family protein [Luteolibacter marinus]|uniref:prolipoprotein diacylglyceryl transferase family protein n=1 Tax=Luteolibacter marinus TaxID=2776705 RepID=UPI001867A6D4|nr:prolipoprotein diacylglyceryl transferase family protein [Luteolibacter marinus]
MPQPSGSPVYALMLVLGIGLSVVYWVRVSKSDERLPLIYFGGLAGAFVGAKVAYLLAEGWMHFDDPHRWVLWLSGKSVMGALPGGWLGVEIAKAAMGYREPTGDRFALILPLPLLLGRLGCLHAGCCPGIACSWGSWPAVPVEIAFQVTMLVVMLILNGRRLLQGQHFHLYLIAYGLFRFFHEFLRATPKSIAGLSGYQWIALATVIAALVAWRIRAEKMNGNRRAASEPS